MRKVLMLVATLFLISGCSNTTKNDSFWTNDYAKAVEQAQKEEKNIIVIVTRDVCPWCKKLKEETLSDERVATLIKENFIPVYLEAPRDIATIEKHGLRSKAVPATILLDTKAREFGRLEGFMNANMYLAEIEHMIGK